MSGKRRRKVGQRVQIVGSCRKWGKSLIKFTLDLVSVQQAINIFSAFDKGQSQSDKVADLLKRAQEIQIRPKSHTFTVFLAKVVLETIKRITFKF